MFLFINSKFSLDDNINDKLRNVYMQLVNMKEAKVCTDENLIRKLITSFIRQHLNMLLWLGTLT